MGDHGGGQKELGDTAKKLDDKYAPQGIHVYFCGDVYKANDEFDKYLTSKNLPLSSHAGIPDTSEMIYLGQDKGWVRMDLVATAVGDPMRKPGEPRDPNARRVNNGITGDARPSTAALGKMIFDMKVAAAVKQIRPVPGPGGGDTAMNRVLCVLAATVSRGRRSIETPGRHPSAHAWRAERGSVLVSGRKAPDLSNYAAAVRLRPDVHYERGREQPAPGLDRQGPHHLRVLPGGQQAYCLCFHAPCGSRMSGESGPQQRLPVGGLRGLRYLPCDRRRQDREAPDGNSRLRRGGDGQLEDGKHRVHVAGLGRSGSVEDEGRRLAASSN